MESKHYNRVDHSHILDKANKVWNSNQRLLKYVKIYYNLFYTETIHPNTFDWIEKELHHDGLKIFSQYYLRYTPGAFARAHCDDNNLVKKTAITLIDKSDDLEGGDIIVYEPHYKRNMEVNDTTINRYNLESYREGDTITPVIVKQQVGETIEYAHNLKHSVSKVLKGHRTVLVSWYCDENVDPNNVEEKRN